MPKIGAELEHLAIRIETASIPVHDRAHREGMAQVVDARAATVFTEPLRLAKADLLAHEREVVSGAAVSRALAILEKEERHPARAKDTVTFRPIGSEPLSCTERYRCETAFAILPPSDREHGFLEVDVFLVEPERFVHSQASDSDQSEQGR